MAGRSQFKFDSVDSTPRGLSHQVAYWCGPALLILFAILSTASLYAMTTIPMLRQTFPVGDLVMGRYDGSYAISVRIFILCYFISYAAFCHRNPLTKLVMGLDLCVFFALACATIDIASVLIYQTLNVAFPLVAAEILSGVVGFGIYSIKILERGRMPPTVPMVVDTSRNGQTILRAALIGFFCAWLSIYVTNADHSIVDWLRSVALLGGIGPGVVLFIPSFFFLLFLGGLADQITYRSHSYAADISVIVPAHNETHIIERTLRAIDVAAEQYDAGVEVIVIDNASSDNTYGLAKEIAADLNFARFRILREHRPGKANALNTGLAAVKTDYFIRIDADTVVRPSSFKRAMVYFRDDDVGVVGGLPLPPGNGPFDHARFVEAVIKHGMYSVGLAAINGIVGVPGMFAVFRTELPRELGGFVGGMNGEDTDMSLRIGEMGYRLIVDPQVRYVSEVPTSYAHMREQRTRWFRSVYHVTARCRAVVFSRDITFRGKVILPYMLLNSARRAMMVPLIIFGTIEYLGQFKPLDILVWQSILAMVLGAPLIAAALALIVNGYIYQLLYLPEYVIFRVLRAYFTLESNLSIDQKMFGDNLYKDSNSVAAGFVRPRLRGYSSSRPSSHRTRTEKDETKDAASDGKDG